MYKIHVQKVNWHEFGVHLGYIVHNPRFWAAVALTTLLGLMILVTIMSKSTSSIDSGPVFPMYPYGIPFH